MQSDFSKPQRQSLLGIFILFADSLQSSIRALFPILIISLFNDKNKTYYLILGAVVLLLALIVGYLRYRNFTFFVDEDNEEFVVHKGILSKTRIAIPLNKIQQVNLNQSLLQRILSVHALEIDTAGSAKTEVTIKAITQKYALVLKERLLEEGFTPHYEEADYADRVEHEQKKQRPFIRVSPVSLLKTGITSNYVRSFGLLLAFFISTSQYVDDYLTYSDTDAAFINEYFNKVFLLRFIFSIIFVILVLTLLVNLVRTMVRYYNFTVTKQHNALLLSHGLIATRNTIIRPEKVQIVSVGRNFFQKKFNINDIKIRQAADLEQSRERRKMAMEIPGVNEQEKNILMQFLLEKMPERGFTVVPNIRKVILNIFRLIIIPVALFYAYTRLVTDVAPFLILIPFYVVFIGILIYFGFRHNRLFISPDFIIMQHGAWDVENDFIAPHKIQAIKLTQYFWQKSSNVGTVKIYTAGGNVNFGLANFTQLKKLTNFWLYQVETTDKNWM
ncbi:PH domain-containing protein [Flavobacterium rhizosphaerae]|uniref:PH domain-containing protein n=1 Tax=Flavobacterium rhizosphaerae TaxID=3163298 RepID=A0ABW8YWB8_9FLAO